MHQCNLNDLEQITNKNNNSAYDSDFFFEILKISHWSVDVTIVYREMWEHAFA